MELGSRNTSCTKRDALWRHVHQTKTKTQCKKNIAISKESEKTRARKNIGISKSLLFLLVVTLYSCSCTYLILLVFSFHILSSIWPMGHVHIFRRALLHLWFYVLLVITICGKPNIYEVWMRQISPAKIEASLTWLWIFI